MALKNTVAIIGATGSTGAFIAKSISSGPYRLLLMDYDAENLNALQTTLTGLNSSVETEVMQCCKDASWEADIIVVAVSEKYKRENAEKMREVATCKTVINLIQAGSEGTKLQELLPFAKVINVLFVGELDTGRVVVTGSDEEAMATAVNMIKFFGLPYNVTE